MILIAKILYMTINIKYTCNTGIYKNIFVLNTYSNSLISPNVTFVVTTLTNIFLLIFSGALLVFSKRKK